MFIYWKSSGTYFCSDYVADPRLDRYEEEGLDEAEYSMISADERRRAEQELDIRDRIERGEQLGEEGHFQDAG